MAVVGRLTDDGELKLAGTVDTRLPMVTDGLVAHHPMDETTKGIANLNMIDYSTWVIGSTGSQTGFLQNGDGNSIVEDAGPFGEAQAIWQTLDNDVASDADGGFLTDTFAIDATKKYRFSVWVKRAVLGNGTFYFGLNGFGTTDGVYDHSLGGGAALNTNPYFSTSDMTGDKFNKWLLVVGYVWPHDNTDYVDMADNGYYKAFNTSRIQVANDYRWHSSTTSVRHRTYLYYSTVPATRQIWAYPRVDLIDGTEPSIEDLVTGEGNVTNPTVDTNTSLTPLGVGVEQLTTNIQIVHPTIANVTSDEGAYAPGWSTDMHTTAVSQDSGWSNGYNGGVVDPTTAYHAQWVYDNDHNSICMLFRDEPSPVTGTLPTWMGLSKSSSGTASALGITDNMDVTLSWLQKTSNLGKAGYCGLYHLREIEGTSGFESNIGYGYNTKVDEWERVSFTSNTGTNWNLSSAFTFYCYGHQSAAGTVMIRDVQLELSDHQTSFTETSRGSSGVLELPFNQVPPYTIQFKHKSSYPITNQVDQSHYPYILQLGNYYANASISFWNYNKNLTLFVKGDASGVWTANTTHLAYNAGNWDNVEHDYALVAVNNTTFKVYIDGVDSGVSTVSSEDVTNISVLKLGYNGSVANAIFRDFSTYDRALSADEILKNAKGTHSITANGLITKQIREEPAIDKDSHHFSFGTDSKSNWNALKTVTEANTVYENGGVFVGTGTTNLITNQDLTTWSNSNCTVTLEDETYNGNPVYKVLYPANALGSIYLNDIGSILGDITHSVSYRRGSNTDEQVPVQMYIRQINSGSVYNSILLDDFSNEWNTLDVSANLGVSTNLMFLLYNNSSALPETGEIFFSMPQSETRAFRTPFVDGTRGQTDLHLPYYTIDCKNDFTIYGWWYPKEYATGVGYHPCLTRNIPNSNSTGNRLLIMGAGTTSRRLQCWHGSDGVNESTVTTAAGVVEVKDDEWNFFCLKRDGANMHIFLGNTDGFTTNSTATAFRLDADEATTQVWHVGEYLNGESDAYHKDYVFQQSAITDADIEQVFKRKMKATNNGLIIQNNVSTKKTL